MSDNEFRIRKAKVIPDDQIRFNEESSRPLSNRDRDIFLALLDKAPAANRAFRQAAAKNKKRHG
jgi:hypothetical protein